MKTKIKTKNRYGISQIVYAINNSINGALVPIDNRKVYEIMITRVINDYAVPCYYGVSKINGLTYCVDFKEYDVYESRRSADIAVLKDKIADIRDSIAKLNQVEERMTNNLKELEKNK